MQAALARTVGNGPMYWGWRSNSRLSTAGVGLSHSFALASRHWFLLSSRPPSFYPHPPPHRRGRGRTIYRQEQYEMTISTGAEVWGHDKPTGPDPWVAEARELPKAGVSQLEAMLLGCVVRAAVEQEVAGSNLARVCDWKIFLFRLDGTAVKVLSPRQRCSWALGLHLTSTSHWMRCIVFNDGLSCCKVKSMDDMV